MGKSNGTLLERLFPLFVASCVISAFALFLVGVYWVAMLMPHVTTIGRVAIITGALCALSGFVAAVLADEIAKQKRKVSK